MSSSRIRTASILTLCLIVLAACDHPGDVDSAADPAPRAGGASAKDRASDSQEYMAWIHLQSHDPSPPPESYTYECAVSGWIDLDEGGSVSGRAPSWNRIYSYFSYYMLPDAVDRASLADPDAEEVFIEVWVPVADTVFPCPDADMPVILEPDGLTYKPGMAAMINLSLHEALEPTCEPYGYYFFEVVDDGGGGYSSPYCSYTSASTAQAQAKAFAPPPPVRDPLEDVECATGIFASVPHHSRWALSKDDPDGGDGDGMPPFYPVSPCD